MDNKDNYLLENDDDFLPLTPSEEPKKEEEIKPDIINPQSSNERNIIPLSSIVQEANNTKPEQPENNDVKKMIYNYAKILPVLAFTFVSVLGIYIFVRNVKADIKNLIKIEEKAKVGYINDEGSVIVKPKYLYGSDFYKGYAIVKNYNNLYGMIDSKGDNEIAFGNIFSANLFNSRYVVSKFTKNGLKMGLLDSALKEVTQFNYDNISYSKDGIFLFTKDNTMGIMNNEGKEIYSYKVDDVDDKNVSIEVSNLSGKSTSDVYAEIKINSSSTIINTKTGKEVYKYTLDDIKVLDNNVFYIKNEGKNNTYFVIKNDKVVYQTDQYRKLRIEDLDSDIALAIKEDASVDYINLLTKEKINENENIKYTYSDGVILQEAYNFQSNKNEYTVRTPNKVIGTFSDIKLVDLEFINGYAKINTENNKYNFINKKGHILSNKEYEFTSDFNKNGYAIVSNDDLFGIIDSNGKEVIDVKYDGIKFINSNLFDNINKLTSEQLFVFKENNKYGIINSNNKVVVKPVYDGFKIVTTKYPIIQATYNKDNILINLITYKDLSIDSSDNIQIYEDYIVSNNEYYNYKGELIYGGDK